MARSGSFFFLSFAALQVHAICDSTVPLTLGADYYNSISCVGAGGEDAMDAYPSQQSVRISSTFHGGGYDVYDAYLTSGASCSASPTADAAALALSWCPAQALRRGKPHAQCHPPPHCSAAVQPNHVQLHRHL